MIQRCILGCWLLAAAHAAQAASQEQSTGAPPPPSAQPAPAHFARPDANAAPLNAAHPEAKANYRADLGLDLGADTFLFRGGQTAFELELSPRLGVLLGPHFDAGFYAGAGYGGPIPEWSQMTMFGIGPYAGLTVPLRHNLNFSPWLGVMYHYAFIEGFVGPQPALQRLAFPQQSVRIDFHADLAAIVTRFTAFHVGLFAKTRLAPISEGPGTAAQLSYGLRLSATSSF